MEKKAKIAVLVSGGDTNLQALIDAQNSGIIQSGEIKLVISNNPNAYALTRAENAGIKGMVITKKQCGSQSAFEDAIIAALEENEIDLIVLAGFMSILSEHFTARYPKRILNVHPSLIPSFCGVGFYGLRVHEEALRYGVKLSGAAVHFVSEECDGGPIIAQKGVAVREDDTPETLQRRIMEEAEWKLLPEAVKLFCQDRLSVEGRIVKIKEN
jgi:phosphoribosylglycinamide formyltransferase-1